MAKLSTFRVDRNAIINGEWVELEEWGGIRILSRGWNDTYANAQARMQREAARSLGGDVDRLPAEVRRKINVECLIRHVLLDVGNLHDDAGQPVDFAAFCDYLRSDEYPKLVLACFEAAGTVGNRKTIDIEEAAGPLGISSDTASSGDASQSS